MCIIGVYWYISVFAPNRQLGTVSHTVFKENVRLNEALNYYVKEAEELKKTNVTLTEKNASLALLKVLPLTDYQRQFLCRVFH